MCDVPALSSRPCEDTEKRWRLALGRTTLDGAPTCVPVFGSDAERCPHTCSRSSSLAGARGDVLLLTAVQPTYRRISLPAPAYSELTDTGTGRGHVRNKASLLELGKRSRAWLSGYAQGNGLPAVRVSRAGRAPEKFVLKDALQCRQLLQLTLLVPLRHAQLLHQNLSVMEAHR